MSDNYIRCADSVAEGASCEIEAQLVDEDGVFIDATQVETLEMSLWALTASRPIIQGVLNEDALNANMGALNITGGLTITLLPGHNVITDPPSEHETHRILVVWTYAGGNRTGKSLIDYDIYRVDWAAP